MARPLAKNVGTIALIMGSMLVSLYIYLYEAQRITALRPYFGRGQPSALRILLEEVSSTLESTTQVYLEGFQADTTHNCASRSEFFEGSVSWYLNEVKNSFNDWWKESTEWYLNDLVANTRRAAIEGVWLKDRRERLHNRNSQLLANYYQTEASVKAHKFVRPENAHEGAANASKITIISASDVSSGIKLEQCKQAIAQREDYAEYHGNKFIFYNLTKYHGAKTVEHPVWLKLPLIEETFNNDPDCEWVWWLDTDIVLTNGNFDLSLDLLNPAAMAQRYLKSAPVPELLDRFGPSGRSPNEFDFNKIDFVLSIDYNGINMGSVLVHRSQVSSEVLQVWSDPLQVYTGEHTWRHVRREQDAFARLWHDLAVLREHTAFVGGPALNSYATNCSTRWVVGDTLVHLAGRSGYSSYDDEWNRSFEMGIAPGDPTPEDYGVGMFPAAQV